MATKSAFRHHAALALLLPTFAALYAAQLSTALAQGTAFTYQGRLNAGGGPANGNYDFRFRLASDPLANNYVGGNVFTNGLPISNGLFLATMDFGAVFNGSNYWLEVAVRTNGGGIYTTLSPLQPLTPTPYAVMAGSASNLLGELPAVQLSGTISSAQVGGSYLNPVAFNNPANSFAGNGGGLTNVNAATLGGVGAGNFWQLTGNNVAPGQFLGSTNNQAVEVWINNARGLRVEPATDLNIGFAPNVIGGHQDNAIVPGITASVIGGGGGAGGLSNTIASTESVIAGGYLNHIEAGNAHASAIGGGFDNVIQYAANRSVIAGGHGNRIGTNSEGSAVSGGEVNVIGTSAVEATIAGGLGNTIGTSYSFVGAGFGNTLQPLARFSVIGGGETNLILTGGDHSVIGGGAGNTNGAPYATVPGGFGNYAAGQFSFAAGRQAKATTEGAFVWADSLGLDFSSTAPNQFLIRASGGVGIGTNNPSAALHVVGNSPAAMALRISNGGLAVSGAGIGTSTPAFIHQATAANIVPGFLHLTLINHPLCNGDPNAILIVTPNWNAGGGVL